MIATVVYSAHGVLCAIYSILVLQAGRVTLNQGLVWPSAVNYRDLEAMTTSGSPVVLWLSPWYAIPTRGSGELFFAGYEGIVCQSYSLPFAGRVGWP